MSGTEGVLYILINEGVERSMRGARDIIMEGEMK